jgi:hypothetical protein
MASFEKHLFISYAHIDNQPLPPKKEGWISRFHATLEGLEWQASGRVEVNVSGSTIIYRRL